MMDIPNLNGVAQSINQATYGFERQLQNSPEARTARATEEINLKFDSLSADLEAERQERKVADTEIQKATTGQNKKTNRHALAALIIGILGLLVAIFAILFSWFIARTPVFANDRQTNSYAGTAQCDTYNGQYDGDYL